MKPAEAADELRALTALHIANPKRLVALEMGVKYLGEAALDPVERVKKLFRSLSHEEREAVVEPYCNVCWADGACRCVEGVEDDRIAEWMETHQNELKQYRGMHIAIHSEKGVVASGRTFTETLEKVKAAGLLNEVAFNKVPLWKAEESDE